MSPALAEDSAIERLRSEATAAGVDIDVRQEPYTGELADTVVQVAKDVDASVIVIGLPSPPPPARAARSSRR